MKKTYLFSLVLVLIASTFSAKAQVTGMPAGYITVAPTVSTAEAPVWYNMMASNTDVLRVNRYMYFDGTNLKTDLYNSPGITDALQNDKYLWRLEQGVAGAGYVILVNKSTGKRLFADAAIVSDAGFVGVADAGIDWKIATAKSTGAAGALDGQYCFNFEGSGLRYLNAGDGVIKNWGILVFNGAGSPAKSSGWFFYPVTTAKTVTYAQAENGVIAVTGTNGTATPSAVATGGSVLVGTVATVTLTPTSGYRVSSVSVNGADVTSLVVGGVYQFPVNVDATVVATFSVTTGIVDAKNSTGVSPNPFRNSLNVANKLAGSKIYVYDLCGKQALVSERADLNTSSLPVGTYIVKYATANGSATVKAVKQ